MPRKRNNQDNDIIEEIEEQDYIEEDTQEDTVEPEEDIPKKKNIKSLSKKTSKKEIDIMPEHVEADNVLPPEIKDIVEKNDKMNLLLSSDGYEVNVVRFMTGKQGKKDFIWKDNWMETPLELHEIISAINGSGYFNLLIRPKGNKDYFQTKYFPFNVTPEDYAEAIRISNEKKQMSNIGNILNTKPNPLGAFGGNTTPLNHFGNNQYPANDLSYALLEEMKEMRKEILKKPDSTHNDMMSAILTMSNDNNNRMTNLMTAIITGLSNMGSKGNGGEMASIVKAISDQSNSQYQALATLVTAFLQNGATKSSDMQSIETAMNIIGKAKDFSAGAEGGGIMDKLGEGLASSLPQLLPLVMNNKPQAPIVQQPIHNPIQTQQMDDNTIKSIVGAINILNEKVEMLARNNNKQIPLSENVSVNPNPEIIEQPTENKGEDVNIKLKMAFGLIRQATKRNDLTDEMIMKQLEDIKDEFIAYSKTECNQDNKNETIEMIEIMAEDGNVMADLLLSMIDDNQEGMLYPLLSEFNMDSDIVAKIKDIVEYYKTLPIEDEEAITKGEEHVEEKENKN